ncbi:hypothetical protein Tco_1024959, partial [Tanacetum coccineum]
VFGHVHNNCGTKSCGKNVGRKSYVNNGNEQKKDGFVRTKKFNKNANGIQAKGWIRISQMPKEKEVNKGNERQKNTPNTNDRELEKNKQQSSNTVSHISLRPESAWKLNKENIEELRKSANKFYVLKDLDDTELSEEHNPNGE